VRQALGDERPVAELRLEPVPERVERLRRAGHDQLRDRLVGPRHEIGHDVQRDLVLEHVLQRVVGLRLHPHRLVPEGVERMAGGLHGHDQLPVVWGSSGW
jgi:hypothetical protein